jgi:hypothetical protein
MKNYKVIEVYGRKHVVRSIPSRGGGSNNALPDADYMGTGMALCGVLNDNETLDEWEIRIANQNAERQRRRDDALSK